MPARAGPSRAATRCAEVTVRRPRAGNPRRLAGAMISTILWRDFSDTPAHLSRLCGRRRCEAGKSLRFVDREGHQDTIKQGLRWPSLTVSCSSSGLRGAVVRTVDTWLDGWTAGFSPSDDPPVVAKALPRISSAELQDVGACFVLPSDRVRRRSGLDGSAATTGERVEDRVSPRLSSYRASESRRAPRVPRSNGAGRTLQTHPRTALTSTGWTDSVR